MSSSHEKFMKRAMELARKGMESNLGGPFGAVVVKDGSIIGEGCNRVVSDNDPTAHAEMVAIRDACDHINDFQLAGCDIYTTCEPCPMCLGAIYWARPERIFFSASREDAAAAGFDDEFIYDELEKEFTERRIPMVPILKDQGKRLFRGWINKDDKTEY